MRLGDITGQMLREAVAVFVEEAYGTAVPRRKVPDLSVVDRVGDSLPLMEDESRRQGAGHRARRWVLRLGNSRYPNMKLVLEEYLLEGEFVFTVDTHDDAVVSPGDPDGPAWQEIRRWNLALKRRIEERWKKAGLPTYAALREKLARPPATGRLGPPRGTILVVDDEPDIADTVAAVLTGGGFRVLKASDGPQALEVLGRERPDLILMDYEMPDMKGTDVCARIRRSRRDRDIPVLLATAAMVDLAAIADADGFLVKPYQRDVLLSFVTRLARKPSPGVDRGAFRRPARRGPVGSTDRPSPPPDSGAGGAAPPDRSTATDEEE